MLTPSEKMLKENNLNLTLVRKKVLELFLKADAALVHAEIEKELHDTVDRITIYRTLQIFLKKGLIHSIPTTDNSIKYALTKEDLKHKPIQENHIHFICTNCNKTICLEGVTVPAIKIPAGYKAQLYELVITGTCADCNRSKHEMNLF